MDDDYEMDYEDDNFYEEDVYEEYGDNEQYYNTSDALYEILPQSALFKKLVEAGQSANTLTALPFGWNILLLRQFKWNVDYLPQYFQKPDFYRIKIQYSPKYKNPNQLCDKMEDDCCMICCSEGKLIENICGCSFCEQCWIGHIVQHVNSINPFMKCMGCQVPLLYEVIQILFSLKPEYQKYNLRYQKQLCQLFSTANRSYQCCPGADCANCIKCQDYSVATVKCTCGKMFCFKCSNDDHSPCTCQERQKWLDMVLKEEADAKWMAINTKLCPSCNKAVQRSAGCNYMACICGKSFCYMCSKPWQPDHKDHFKCHIYKKSSEENISKEKAILEKMNFYAEKYLNANKVVGDLKKIDTFDKRKLLFQVLAIDLSETDFIDQAYKFAIECCDSLKWTYVYCYYVKFIDSERKEYFDFSQGEYEKYKENLLKKLSIDLMTFLKDLEKREMEGKPINKEEEMEKFLALKKNITNYFKCTKQFKEKFVEGIEKTDLSLIKRYSQDKPMESSQAKGKKKGKK